VKHQVWRVAAAAVVTAGAGKDSNDLRVCVRVAKKEQPGSLPALTLTAPRSAAVQRLRLPYVRHEYVEAEVLQLHVTGSRVLPGHMHVAGIALPINRRGNPSNHRYRCCTARSKAFLGTTLAGHLASWWTMLGHQGGQSHRLIDCSTHVCSWECNLQLQLL
jgi:hypothetical protein